MPITMQGVAGALFNSLGKLGLLISQLRTYQSAQNTNLTSQSTGVVGQLNSEPDIQAIVGSSYLSQLSAPESVGGLAQSVAEQVVSRLVFRDSPRLNQTLTSLNTDSSILEIIRQMNVNGDTVLAATIAGTAAAFIGNGDGAIVFSARRPSDGLVLENTLAETIKITCTSDSFTGGATAGNETMTVTGEGSQTDVFAFDWPLGSNLQTTLNAIDGNTDNGSGNILTNTGFLNWTSNIPDNYTLVTGTAGTNIAQETTIVFDNTGSSLRITGDAGGTLTQLRQQFNSSTGTQGTLSALTQYGFNIYLRRDGTVPGAGILTIDLVDGNFAVIKDENGTDNSFTIDLTSLTVGFQSFTGVFRTPEEMPTTYYWRMRLSTALTDGRSVYCDKGSLGLQNQLYTSGPFLSVHSGSDAFSAGDYATIDVTNSRGSAGTLNTWQTLIARLLPSFISNEYLLPSSASPSVSDALIG